MNRLVLIAGIAALVCGAVAAVVALAVLHHTIG